MCTFPDINSLDVEYNLFRLDHYEYLFFVTKKAHYY